MINEKKKHQYRIEYFGYKGVFITGIYFGANMTMAIENFKEENPRADIYRIVELSMQT